MNMVVQFGLLLQMQVLNHGLQVCYDGGARVSFLEVRAGNRPALHLYETTGYHTESVRKQYYQDNHEDALLMNLDPAEYEALIRDCHRK